MLLSKTHEGAGMSFLLHRIAMHLKRDVNPTLLMLSVMVSDMGMLSNGNFEGVFGVVMAIL